MLISIAQKLTVLDRCQIYYKEFRLFSQEQNPNIKWHLQSYPQAPASPSYFPVLGDSPDHAHSSRDVHDPVLRPRRLHHGPRTAWQPPNTPGSCISQDPWRWLPTSPKAGSPTFGVVPVDPFPDQGLPLPEGDPQEVMGPATDLDSLPGRVHQRP